jgi:hypothetical protein
MQPKPHAANSLVRHFRPEFTIWARDWQALTIGDQDSAEGGFAPYHGGGGFGKKDFSTKS